MNDTDHRQQRSESSRVLGEYWDGRVQEELSRSEYHPEKRLYIKEMRRAIDHSLSDVQTILDVGAGYGQFSIDLAARGYHVVHTDPSSDMLEVARRLARERGIAPENFTAVNCDVRDLSAFPDGAFDLVLCLDAPVSFVGDEYTSALRETTRVTRSRVMISVLNRTGLLPVWLADEVRRSQSLSNTQSLYETGAWIPQKVAGTEGEWSEGDWFPTSHFFLPDELSGLLEQVGFAVTDLAAPGSLARLMPLEVLSTIMVDPDLEQQFLELTERYSREPSVLGVGGSQAAGLLVTAERQPGSHANRRPNNVVSPPTG